MSRYFCPLLIGIDRLFLTMNDKVVDAVFDIRGRIWNTEKTLRVGLILCEQKRRGAFRVNEALTEILDVKRIRSRRFSSGPTGEG